MLQLVCLCERDIWFFGITFHRSFSPICSVKRLYGTVGGTIIHLLQYAKSNCWHDSNNCWHDSNISAEGKAGGAEWQSVSTAMWYSGRCFFGMPRCIGTTKKQIMSYVCRKALCWCKYAIPVGLAGGTVVVGHWSRTVCGGCHGEAWGRHRPACGWWQCSCPWKHQYQQRS